MQVGFLGKRDVCRRDGGGGGMEEGETEIEVATSVVSFLNFFELLL